MELSVFEQILLAGWRWLLQSAVQAVCKQG
jgi:hypothetical protein